MKHTDMTIFFSFLIELETTLMCNWKNSLYLLIRRTRAAHRRRRLCGTKAHCSLISGLHSDRELFYVYINFHLLPLSVHSSLLKTRICCCKIWRRLAWHRLIGWWLLLLLASWWSMKWEENWNNFIRLFYESFERLVIVAKLSFLRVFECFFIFFLNL